MPSTIKELVDQLHQLLNRYSETALLDAQVLIAHHLNKPRTWVLAHPEAALADFQSDEILQSAQRLGQGEALPYVIGHWEFYGLDFLVTPDVLIPRPETELLVERAIHWLQLNPHKRRGVDVGTGSGCIGISIAKQVPDVYMTLSDYSDPALNIARLNTDKHELQDRIDFLQSNLLDKAAGQYDLICANLPYIPSPVLDRLRVVKREPRLALDGGKDGLKFISLIIEQAKGRLSPGGVLLLEIDPAQRDQVIQISHEYMPHARVHAWQDLAGDDRCMQFDQRYWIFHLCRHQDWLKSLARGAYLPDSLILEGFTHCSQSSQIIEVANQYFKDIPDLIVIRIDPQKLTSKIRWERVGDIFYPHVYGPINLEAVDKISNLEIDSDRTYRFLELPE